MNKAIFLDRDGTLIVDTGYLRDPEQIEFLPDVIDILRKLKEYGYLLVLVSNQSGIGRGYFTEREHLAVQERLAKLLAEQDAALDGMYYCPHSPDEGCGCRKPDTGMAIRAARELGIDLSESYMVGDKLSDIEFGTNFGAKASFGSIKKLMFYLEEIWHSQI
ncbi:MAG: HAD family hydrolase [Clostridiales bacterium]|jgi:D-glycero-D-manno-heptose 1,7-bisphosphate phosphatase|nr:HAD family hydrolase [Clostridiales bacterium]